MKHKIHYFRPSQIYGLTRVETIQKSQIGESNFDLIKGYHSDGSIQALRWDLYTSKETLKNAVENEIDCLHSLLSIINESLEIEDYEGNPEGERHE